jgi:hypothetical protein
MPGSGLGNGFMSILATTTELVPPVRAGRWATVRDYSRDTLRGDGVRRYFGIARKLGTPSSEFSPKDEVTLIIRCREVCALTCAD